MGDRISACRYYSGYGHQAYQQGAYAGQHQGYYDQYGQWHTQGPYGYGYDQQWGYGDQQYGGWNGGYGVGGHWGADNTGSGAAAQVSQKPEVKEDKSAGGKGRGFSMKMGDRAHVKQAFTLEQRQAKEGKFVLSSTEAGDEYGADILLGAGGMVRSNLSLSLLSE
jgi:hypothetical protein